MRGCGCLLVLGLVAIAAVLVVAVAMRPAAQLAPVRVSHAQAVSGQAKLTDVSSAVTRAHQTGKPVAFNETFTDGELSSLVNEHLALTGAPFDAVVLHSNPAGYIEGQASAHLAGQSLPLYLRARVDTSNGQPSLRLIQSKLGMVGVPGSISDQIDAALKQGVNLGTGAPVTNLVVKIGDGNLTLSGIANPA